VLREHRCVVFDDSFMHSARFSSQPKAEDGPRINLILDLWHPDLNGRERRAIEHLYPDLSAEN